MTPIVSALVPLAVELLKLYFKSTDTTKDDKVLEAVQQGCYYLVPNKTNDLSIETADIVANHTMNEGE